MLQVLGAQFGMGVHAELRASEVDSELVARVPIAFAKAHGLVPLARTETGVRVAISDPFDTGCLDDLRLLFDGAEIDAELTTRARVLTAATTAGAAGTPSAKR